MPDLLTTRDLAAAIGASESSIRRWTNSGAIRTSRTAGGHRRIALHEAIRFIRSTAATVVRPELLSIPKHQEGTGPNVALGGSAIEGDALSAALVAGHASAAVAHIMGMYFDGMSLAGVFDGPLAGAMRRIGELWKHDSRGILIEHRATEICLHAVAQLRGALPPPTENARVAVGGAPAGDPYMLPSLMAATVFAEAGYRDVNFGANTPLELLAEAAIEQKASFVWLAASCAPAGKEAAVRRGFKKLLNTCRSQNATLLVGGRFAAKLAVNAGTGVHVLGNMSALNGYLHGRSSLP